MKNTNYVAYYRVSTNSNKQSLSFGFQKDAIDRFIDIYGGSVVKSFTEEVSGSTLNREMFEKAVNYAEQTNSVLLVYKLSRLSRAGLSTVTYLEDRGVEFIEAVSPNDSPFVKGIKLLQAKEENRERKDNIKRGLSQIKRNIAEKGYHISKAGNKITRLGCPENLTQDGRLRSIEIRKNKALENKNNLRAKAIIELLVEKGMSYRGMSLHLNKKGFKTSTGKKFQPATVRNLMSLYGITKKEIG